MRLAVEKNGGAQHESAAVLAMAGAHHASLALVDAWGAQQALSSVAAALGAQHTSTAGLAVCAEQDGPQSLEPAFPSSSWRSWIQAENWPHAGSGR